VINDLNSVDARLSALPNVDDAALRTCNEINEGSAQSKVADAIRKNFGRKLDLSNDTVAKVAEVLKTDLCGTMHSGQELTRHQKRPPPFPPAA